MLNKEEVIVEFKKYGFEYREKISCDHYLVFTFRSGFFHNAEVVETSQLVDEEKITKVIEELNTTGITAKRTKYKNISEVQKKLFHGFFHINRWKEKIRDEYKQFIDRTLNSLPNENLNYSYINTSYTKNGSLIDDESIITDIMEEIKTPGASLILIEAPAGFGKTSTSYELIYKLANSNDGTPMPFFTEFSRDRQARVFSHVFVREVDRNFRDIKSEVVIDELKNGNVVMILDGFDELLSERSEKSDKTGSDAVDQHEKAEPMLETIGELLSKNAKIILTSRRSALFDGEMFDNWLTKYHDHFQFKRYRISSPRVNDWLIPERLETLKSVGIDIYSLSNPVLLTYLRSISSEDFDSLCKEPSKIVNRYFISMLEREQDRQNLNMSPHEQTLLLAEIAGDMAENDYTSDTKEKFLDTIKKRCSSLLEDTRKRYPAKDRPSFDSLANTLSNHAFFDRSTQGDNSIEFVNEFVFGNYISEYVINFKGDWIPSDERFVEPAVNSYMPRTTTEKSTLWTKLNAMKDYVETSALMRYEASMTGRIDEEKYNEKTINSMHFNKIELFSIGKIENAVFNECTFKSCKFTFNNIISTTFISCRFFDCTESGFNTSSTIELLNCMGENSEFLRNIDAHIDDAPQEDIALSHIRREIFETYLPVGSISIERLHIPLSLLLRLEGPGVTRRELMREIKDLKSLGYLTDAHSSNFVAINKNKISEIKQLLGRA